MILVTRFDLLSPHPSCHKGSVESIDDLADIFHVPADDSVEITFSSRYHDRISWFHQSDHYQAGKSHKRAGQHGNAVNAHRNIIDPHWSCNGCGKEFK